MVFLLSLMMNLNTAVAAEFPGCTEWKAERGVSCVFAGRDARVWKRNCSAAEEKFQCRRRPGNNPPIEPCLSEVVCFNYSPDQMESACSEWIKERGVTCGVDRKPVVWRRACQWEVIPTTACTARRKAYPTEEDYIQ